MLGADKKRLSKRHAATSLEEYRDQGYLDSAILNTLARLGWSKGENEVFYLEDLIKDFNLNEIQKAGAVFDIKKLNWHNTQHLANLSDQELEDALNPFLEKLDIDIEDHTNKEILIKSMRTADVNLSLIAKALIPYYKNFDSYDEKALEKFINNEAKEMLKELKELLKVTSWDEKSLDNLLKDFQIKKNLPVPKVFQPVRIALTGSIKSPSLGLTLSIFDKSEALERIERLILTNI